MRLIRFKKFLVTNPFEGQGFAEGTELLITDHEFSDMMKVPGVAAAWRECVEESEIPKEKIYQGGPIPDGCKIAWYYPGGLGDLACHTAIVAALKQQFPRVSIRVFSRARFAGVWAFNPAIESFCARPHPITRSVLNECDLWMLGDAVAYNLTNSDQPNIYKVLSDHFKIPIKQEDCCPKIFVTQEEVRAMIQKLKSLLGVEAKEKKILLFSPIASKENRSWPVRHWVEFVGKAHERGFDVIALGSGNDSIKFSKIQGHCHILCGELTIRELIALTSLASRIVTVDTGLLHLGAAFNIPTVAIFGPFSPEMRSSTYPHCISLWPKRTCPAAPCCFHDEGFPSACPEIVSRTSACEVMDSVYPMNVMAALSAVS